MNEPTLDRRTPIVVLAADNNYAMQLAVVLRSALDHLASDRRLQIFVIDGGITPQNKQKILSSINVNRCTVTWVRATEEALGEVNVSGHVSIATYFRLLIPTLLPHTIDKVIYLDSDLIVNHDLGELWDTDLADYHALAVQAIDTPYVSSPSGVFNYEALGIDPQAKYFNAGVLVMNLKRWRAEEISSKAIAYLNQYKDRVINWDQDGMNAILAEKWGELDPRWNQTSNIHRLSSWRESPHPQPVFEQVLHNPYIIHFASAAKPWNSREVYPANDLFFQYVDKTAWSGWRFNLWRRLQRRLTREIKKFRQWMVSLTLLPRQVA